MNSDDFIQRFEQPHKANIVLSRPWDLKDLSERLPTKPERLDWQQARDIEPTQEISVNLDPRKPGQSTAQAAAQAASSSAFVNPSVPGAHSPVAARVLWAEALRSHTEQPQQDLDRLDLKADVCQIAKKYARSLQPLTLRKVISDRNLVRMYLLHRTNCTV